MIDRRHIIILFVSSKCRIPAYSGMTRRQSGAYLKRNSEPVKLFYFTSSDLSIVNINKAAQNYDYGDTACQIHLYANSSNRFLTTFNYFKVSHLPIFRPGRFHRVFRYEYSVNANTVYMYYTIHKSLYQKQSPNMTSENSNYRKLELFLASLGCSSYRSLTVYKMSLIDKPNK